MATAIAPAGAGGVEDDVLRSITASRKRTHDMFYASDLVAGPPTFAEAQRLRVAVKAVDDYPRQAVPDRYLANTAAGVSAGGAVAAQAGALLLTDAGGSSGSSSSATAASSSAASSSGAAGGAGTSRGVSGVGQSTALVLAGSTQSVVESVLDSLLKRQQPHGVAPESAAELRKAEELTAAAQSQSRAMVARRQPPKIQEPKWHAPWKLMRVVSGHLGWVRAVAVEPGNEWFATGSSDRTIKVWDLATGTLKVTLTGHVSAVRALAVSSRHPYLFSAGEDKQIKCWDLEQNKVVRNYHGSMQSVFALALHPTLDVLVTGGRDTVCRVWDMRTKAPIHSLGGHTGAVSSLLANAVDPQIISGSMDQTVRLWDLAAGKVRVTLTHHKKAVRAMVQHSREFSCVSGAADHLKKWALPSGTFVSNFNGHNSIVNCLALNQDDVMVSGGDDGSLKFWDYETGYSFQDVQTRVQPGSLDSEAGVYATAFDVSGSRLFTCEADKTIKVWREDPEASPASHPIDMEGWTTTRLAQLRSGS